MKKFNILLILAMMVSVVTFAQKDRFTKPVFSEVNQTLGIPYCENYSFEPFLKGKMHTEKQTLKCDFYEPKGDASKKRPLVIFLHTGNFVPQPGLGGSPQGRTTDSVLVELATRLSKMGYACASADYRIGWAPTSTSETTRKFTLINAAYRGIQDVRSCVRFFKKNADTYGVDTSRIVVFGAGTGGYIALGAGTLNSYPEIFLNTTPAGKFMATPTIPMVIEAFNGNINGTSLGIAAVDGLGVPKGDTLCIPSNVGPTSDIQMTVNLGGALGDLSWLDNKSVPAVSFHSPSDPYAPYKEAVLKVPVSATVIFDIVNVMGSYSVQEKQSSLNLNAKWKAKNLADEFSLAANAKNEGFDGLFPITGTAPTDSSPWDWWDATYWSAVPHPSVPGASVHQVALQGAPKTSATRAKLYIDTIVGYFAPRAFAQLDLDKLTTTEVTFSVDMKNETVDPAKGVCVAGNFQAAAGLGGNWTPGSAKMTNKVGTSIWELKVNIPAGDYEFKFINDDTWANGKEEKMTGKGCYSGDNRSVTVGATATTVGTFCYNKCFACDELAVKLSVDMSKEASVDAAGVYVAGAFQGWDPAKTKMTQVGTTKVYSITVGMKTGDQEYKFVNGNAWGKDESIAAGAACGKAGGTNRYIKLGTGGYDAGVVCFKECTKCDGSPSGATATNDTAFDNGLTVFPNPTTGELTLAFDAAQSYGILKINITNALGQTVISRDIQNTNGNVNFDLNNLSEGIYLIHITDGAKFSTKRVVLQK
jgi:hypothetical protein